MDIKSILITAAIVVAVMIVLKKTGIGTKLGLSSFESDDEI